MDEVEKVLFPTPQAIAIAFANMNASVSLITQLRGDSAIESVDITERNQDYLNTLLGFVTIQNANRDLTPYIAALA